MYPATFDYLAPRSLDAAVRMLDELGPAARPLAGGQSLIPQMRRRQRRPAHLVDLRHLELDGIEVDGGDLIIGATATHAAVEASGLVREVSTLLADTAPVIADPLVRNLGTVGGALAHADPASDWGAALLAADATVEVTGRGGSRVVRLDELFTAAHETVLAGDEIVTAVRVPLADGTGGAYRKVRRKVGDFATVGAAVQVTVDAAGRVQRCGIGLAGVDLTCIRARKAEEYLRGRRLDEDRARRAGEIAAEETHPTSDQRGPARYKQDLVRRLTWRGLRAAAGRARGPFTGTQGEPRI